MQALVTGSTGFLGRHLVRALGAEGHAVRALVRDGRAFAHEGGGNGARDGDGPEVVRGDVLEPESLAAACRGVDVVFHAAGKVSHRGEATGLFDLHVGGTRNVLAAARAAGVRRVVHVSTSGTVAVSRDERVFGDDDPWATEVVRRWPYYLSKLYAEKVALEAAAAGDLEVVVVSPTLLLGPGDDALGSSRVLLRFLRREVVAVPPGGLSLVDVRDAAQATAAAATRGRSGQRYLLGGHNMTVEAFLVLAEKVTGIPAPVVRAGPRLTELTAQALDALEGATGDEGDEAAAYDMACHFWYVDAARARRELGLTPRAAEATVRDAVAWLRSRGPIPRAGGLLGSVVGGVRRAFGRR